MIYVHTPMFIAVLFAIAKIQKKPKNPSVDDWIKICGVCVCIYTYIYTCDVCVCVYIYIYI